METPVDENKPRVGTPGQGAKQNASPGARKGTPLRPKMSRGAKMLQAMGVEPPTRQLPKAPTPQKSKSPSPAPVASSAQPDPLPLKYSQLLKILENLLLVDRGRPNRLSFSKAKLALAKMNTRMNINQMGQLVHICPELSWKNLPSERDMTPRERLVLLIDHSNSKNVSESESAIMRGAKQKLKELAESGEEGEVPEVPQAIVPDPTSISMNTPSRSGRRLSSGGRSPYFPSPASVRGPSRITTPTKPPGRGVKRSLFMSPLPKVPGVGRGGALTPVAECDESDIQSIGESTPGRSMDLEGDFRTPVKTRRRSYLFDEGDDEGSDIDMSPCATQALQETLRQRFLMTPERVQARKKGHALAILPETFDLVRAIFRRDNATRIPVQRVVQLMRQSQGGNRGPSVETIRFNLQQVLDHAPQFLRLEQESNVKMLSMDPMCDIKEIRDGLKIVAKNRQSLVQQEEAEENDQQKD
ncbi:hypothetical protein BSKO_04138 [Bryopsis sp. KO-2023]|nr:hypothetical protein BSKO_04138 [Bryopsis sp. KO-2023]